MIIMSVDFGDSRTGIAVCGKSEMIASPVTVINEKDFNECIKNHKKTPSVKTGGEKYNWRQKMKSLMK